MRAGWRRPVGEWLLGPLLLADLVLLVGAAAIGATFADSPSRLFGEGDPITLVSTCYLVGTGWLALQMYRYRRTAVWRRDPALVWLLASIGFVFLGLDDLLRIHERVDEAIHRWLAIEATDLTDRIDDGLVGLYGAVGVGLALWGRAEFSRARTAIRYLVWGFGVFVVMVAIEFLVDAADGLDGWDDVIEDSAKVVAETLLFVGFAAALNAERPLGEDERRAPDSGRSFPGRQGSRAQ